MGLWAFGASPAAAQTPPSTPAGAPAPVAPAAAPASAGSLQDPEQADTRYSAYSLPLAVWGLDVSALGIGGGDAFAKLGVSLGLGAGLDVSMNLAHVGLGLLNLSGGWHFLDTRYFDLGFRVGVWYGHGAWFWTAERLEERIVSQLDVLNVPLALTASVPIPRWAQLDLGLQYTYAQVFGASDSSREASPFSDAQLDTLELFLRPVARWFITHDTALALSAKLPLSSSVALRGRTSELAFSDTWSFEAGLRSRFSRGLFGNLRLYYGSVAYAMYGAHLYPSFELELRL